MKQGKIYTKIVFTAVLCAIMAYLGYAVYTGLRSPMATVIAVQYEAGQGLRTTGYVVRQEQVLVSSYPITALTVGEGQKVAVAEPVATGYASTDAQDRQSELDALQSQLAQLQYADSYSVAEAADAAGLDARITKDLVLHAQNIARRDFSSASEVSPELKGLVLRRTTGEEDLTAIRMQMSQLQSELAKQRNSIDSSTGAITAPQSGYFSGTVDGYENRLSPDKLGAISVSELEAIGPDTTPTGAFGRLITDPTWYYVTAVASQYVKDSSVGDTVDISFSHDFYSTLQMRIDRIGDEENGKRILVLKTYDYIQDVTLLRDQTANIVFRAYTGLRVPKDALRVDEAGNTGVFVLESAKAKWKKVQIAYDNGESYVVALDKNSTNNLWPGDEIIVGVKNLYDGKVVQ